MIAKYLDILLLLTFYYFLLFAAFLIFFFLFVFSSRYIRFKVPGNCKFYFALQIICHMFMFMFMCALFRFGVI